MSSDIANYRIYVFLNGEYVDEGALPKTPNTITITDMIEEYGEYCFTLTTVDTDGRESKPSDEACKLIEPPPNPPAKIMTVEIELVTP